MITDLVLSVSSAAGAVDVEVLHGFLTVGFLVHHWLGLFIVGLYVTVV
jgi:hypothetical protein